MIGLARVAGIIVFSALFAMAATAILIAVLHPGSDSSIQLMFGFFVGSLAFFFYRYFLRA